MCWREVDYYAAEQKIAEIALAKKEPLSSFHEHGEQNAPIPDNCNWIEVLED